MRNRDVKKLDFSKRIKRDMNKGRKELLDKIFGIVVVILFLGFLGFLVGNIVKHIVDRPYYIEVCMKNTGYSREYCSYLAK